MNIYEKISAIMQDVQYLAKDDHVEFGNTKYKALSEEKVTTIMRQELLKHKLVVFPIMQTSNRQGNITHVDVVYRMVNVEDKDEFIDIASCGDGADTQDKGSGKAMTYAFKYMWLRTFALPTGEDPDKISSDELDYNEKKSKEKKKEEPKEHICSRCGNTLRPIMKNDGTIMEIPELLAFGKKKFGVPLCSECMRTALKGRMEDAT